MMIRWFLELLISRKAKFDQVLLPAMMVLVYLLQKKY